MEKYNITYSCGCIHEIEIDNISKKHQSTGNNKECNIHKK